MQIPSQTYQVKLKTPDTSSPMLTCIVQQVGQKAMGIGKGTTSMEAFARAHADYVEKLSEEQESV